MTFRRLLRPLPVMAALLLFGISSMVVAQLGGDHGVTPIDSSGSFEVGGVQVDVTAKTAEAARYGGWRLAQRKGWQALSKRLGGSGALISDSALDSIVSGIIVENEQIGPNRYIARLGVLFDRGRAGSILGVGAIGFRSPPLLTIPVEWSGGVGETVEHRSDWQEAWARFRTGNSAIDYVRPTGTGPDPLLLGAGQIGRPGRGWWRMVLDQYGASDVLIPVVKLYRQWPGGPVIGVFEARYGPDNRFLSRFTLRVGSSEGLPALLDAGVKRIDEAYQGALRAGVLKVDPSLAYIPPENEATDGDADEALMLDLPGLAAATTPISVQVDTPSAGAVTNAESALRAIPGVQSAETTSLAIGGLSVMRVNYAGDPALLQSALQARGWQVESGAGVLRIRRAPAPSLPPPTVPADNSTAG